MAEKEGLIRAALPSPLSPLRGAAPEGFAARLCPGQGVSTPGVSSNLTEPHKRQSPRWAGSGVHGGEGGITQNRLGPVLTLRASPHSRLGAKCSLSRIWSNSRVLINLPLYPLNANAPIRGRLHLDGGEGGIRTLDTFPYTHFPGVRLRPLGHLSGLGAELTTTLPCRTKNPCLKGRADANTEVVILRGLGPVQIEPDRLAVLGPYYPI